jgi:hypothetical protein
MAVSTPDKSANRKLAFAGGPEQFGTTDVEKSASHHVSQNEIRSDNPCSQQLSGETGLS